MANVEAAAAPRRRGRPARISVDAVAETALRLFLDNGFEGTTMTSIAAAAGIGRKTLFGFFPNKADIVWNRFARQLGRLKDALDDAPAGLSSTESVVRAILLGLETDPEFLPVMRAEVVLIQRTPELQSYAYMHGLPWCGAITDFIARHEQLDPEDVLPQVLGHGYWEAMFVGFRNWIRSAEESPLPPVETALRDYSRALRAAFADEKNTDKRTP